jgi:hypothetical protein
MRKTTKNGLIWKEPMMATKKPSNPRKKYRKVNFEIEQMAGCCGIGVVFSFQEKDEFEYVYHGWNSVREETPLEFVTKEEQAEELYKRILEETWGKKARYGDGYSQLMISLVSNYADKRDNKHQFPELEELLIKEGWTIYSVFINPNHGNEVTLYGKYFPERNKHPDDEEEE